MFKPVMSWQYNLQCFLLYHWNVFSVHLFLLCAFLLLCKVTLNSILCNYYIFVVGMVQPLLSDIEQIHYIWFHNENKSPDCATFYIIDLENSRPVFTNDHTFTLVNTNKAVYYRLFSPSTVSNTNNTSSF